MVDNNGNWKKFIDPKKAFLDQAKRQADAAAGTGTPIVWVFAQPEMIAPVKQLFRKNGLKEVIEVIHVPKVD